MTEHYLKIKPEFIDAVRNGIKTHEVRKNDRNYKVGDTLVFYTDDGLPKEKCFIDERYGITHILTSEEFPDGIKEGYAVLSIKKTENKRNIRICCDAMDLLVMCADLRNNILVFGDEVYLVWKDGDCTELNYCPNCGKKVELIKVTE